MNYQSLNESIRSVTNPKTKASPQEDEFLTDLTRAQIAAIKPLMKSKNWNKLKAYLVSQKIVDKNFNDITRYKMDRDVLSVLQRSFSTYHEQVENKQDYIELLESALETIAEELELDPNELLEAYRMTPARSAVLERERSKIFRRGLGARPIGVKKDGTYKWSKLAKKDKPQFDADSKRMDRIRAITRKTRNGPDQRHYIIQD